MPTPDFEDWLDRQDIDISYSTTAEKWRQYMIDEFGIHGGSLDVAEQARQAKYEILPMVGIRPIEYEVQRVGYVETITRYVITEMPGLWGRIRAYEIAADRLTERREFDKAEIASRMTEEARAQPLTRRIKYE